MEEEGRDGAFEATILTVLEGRKEVGDTSMTSLVKTDSDFFNSGGREQSKGETTFKMARTGKRNQQKKDSQYVLGVECIASFVSYCIGGGGETRITAVVLHSRSTALFLVVNIMGVASVKRILVSFFNT